MSSGTFQIYLLLIIGFTIAAGLGALYNWWLGRD
jgi:membrane protein YqaA with SNARE-associated domain